MVDAQLNNEGADDNIPQFTLEKGIIPSNQSIQQIKTALRELLKRQTREAEIATEAMKRAEAMATNQQTLLEEAEKRDQELKEKLRNRFSNIDEDEGVADSRSRTWKPSVVAGNPPAKENNKHPFPLIIFSEELPKKFKYPTDLEPYDGSSDPKHHLDAFDNRMHPGSIKSFSDLSGGFLKNFTTRRRLPKTCLNLYSIAQKPKESLRDYLDRFNSECTQIEGLEYQATLMALVKGL
ncbi:hypothetical protein PIB30_037214 [Stylosanthes scabra]|uniref:Retrotransposon gag domain-containing protein n=1 Tax=Stylosanthes scabra TaxID=79078 RepID=A0ABU6ZC37_9FABA|nr:hypothetical protein [Stylosanthes scabra]